MKTYMIVDATIEHPELGTIIKQNIEYYVDGTLENVEFYSKEGVITGEIRSGYVNQGAEPISPQAIVPNEIDNSIGHDN